MPEKTADERRAEIDARMAEAFTSRRSAVQDALAKSFPTNPSNLSTIARSILVAPGLAATWSRASRSFAMSIASLAMQASEHHATNNVHDHSDSVSKGAFNRSGL